MPKLIAPPKPCIPLDQRDLKRITSAFDAGLEAVKDAEIRFPDYRGWLGDVERCSDYRFERCPRPKVDDSYPPELAHTDYGRERVELLYRTLEHILKEGGVFESLSSGIRFRSDKYPRPEEYAKVYGCVKTSEAFNFARKIGRWKEENPQLHFRGKFYQSVTVFPAHNKLCLYVPFEGFGQVMDILTAEKNSFNPIEFNHPIGVQVFPGVSAVIMSDEVGPSFDDRVQSLLDGVKDDMKKGGNFVRKAKAVLETDSLVGYYFTYLSDREK